VQAVYLSRYDYHVGGKAMVCPRSPSHANGLCGGSHSGSGAPGTHGRSRAARTSGSGRGGRIQRVALLPSVVRMWLTTLLEEVARSDSSPS
jgi:hypothetical protein